jgi:catechol 2,3-dioxygenase-like lactoylglutathione lyase family enzyme
MEMLLERPIAVCDPSRSLLSNEHFQMGYVTNDMAKAEEFFRKRFGVREFRPTEGDLADGGHISVRSVWIGTVMYEIICATGPGSEIYSEPVPEGDFAIRLHHFGFLVPDDAAWDMLEETVECGGWTVRQRSETPGYVRAMFVEAPELGAYLEFVFPAPALLERFRATPVA